MQPTNMLIEDVTSMPCYKCMHRTIGIILYTQYIYKISNTNLSVVLYAIAKITFVLDICTTGIKMNG